MPFNIEIPDDFLSEDEKKKMTAVLKAKSGDEFNVALRTIILASLSEYKQMMTGNGVLASVQAIEQYRLFLLIKYFFRDGIPTEEDVAHIFQITPSQSKILIRNTMTRYRYDLETDIQKTLCDTLKKAEPCTETDNMHSVNIKSANVLEELNLIISEKAPKLTPIKKTREMAKMYDLPCDSLKVLCEHLNIQKDQIACVNRD